MSLLALDKIETYNAEQSHEAKSSVVICSKQTIVIIVASRHLSPIPQLFPPLLLRVTGLLAQGENPAGTNKDETTYLASNMPYSPPGMYAAMMANQLTWTTSSGTVCQVSRLWSRWFGGISPVTSSLAPY